MARKTLKDDKGRAYDVDVPDEDEDDSDTLWLDEEDIEWLRKKRREEAESERQNSQSNEAQKTSGKVVRIRAKQQTSENSPSAEKTRRRTLRLA
jgi:hypothetical protein